MTDAQPAMRRSQFRILPPPRADVVFLGDSITEYGLWNEWFPEITVVNRGIAGDTTGDILELLGSAIGAQRVVCLLAGTNDLEQDVPTERIAENVDTIVNRIPTEAPTAKIIINSVMPRASSFHNSITELNTRLRAVADRRHAVYLDLWPTLADQRGALRAEFSLDRLHLTGQGYKAWVSVLAEQLI